MLIKALGIKKMISDKMMDNEANDNPHSLCSMIHSEFALLRPLPQYKNKSVHYIVKSKK